MRKFILLVMIAVAATALQGCFSLGVTDEDAYLALFDGVTVIASDYAKNKQNLSKFVKGDEFHETVSPGNYRYVAMKTKERIVADEMGAYVYLPEGEEARQLTVTYYVADKLPEEKKDQKDEAVPYDPGLSEGTTRFYQTSVRLSPGQWNDLYARFGAAVEIPEGSYMLLAFVENNDATYSGDDGYVPKTQNDVKLTVDKLLLHIRS